MSRLIMRGLDGLDFFLREANSCHRLLVVTSCGQALRYRLQVSFLLQ